MTIPDSTLAGPQEIIADLRRQLARAQTERDEALARETAAADMLRVINASSGDLAPVWQTMVEKARLLCDATHAVLRTYDGAFFHLVASAGERRLFELAQSFGPISATGPMQGRLVRGEDLVHIADVRETAPYREVQDIRDRLDLWGIRTWLAVALRRDGALLGTIIVSREVPRPFSDKQIALLRNFAAQAVIAMENARLITETREALDQQTATAEVLGVINASPGDLAPVFDAILEKATRLCEAPRGQLAIVDGGQFRFVAVHGDPGFTEAQFARGPMRPEEAVTWVRIAGGERIVHIADVKDTDLYRDGHDAAHRFVDHGGGRSLLTVALRKDDALLGALSLYRQEVRPFTGKQIVLLENFAEQAVIAMENARLITETREALEQQTATAEVLGVINSSPGDLAPVFDAMLEKAMRLCGGAFGLLTIYDGQKFQPAAMYGLPSAFAEFTADPANQPGTGGASPRLLRGERIVHVIDLKEEEPYRAGDPYRRALVDLGGARTLIAVPLRRDNAFLGVINIYRQEVREFSDKEIALLENFAAQAVIAMENARLITETREALEQQTATAEVLGVINSSPGDLTPVFEAMLDRASRLSEAAFGTFMLRDGERFHAAAVHGAVPAPFAEIVRAGFVPGPASPIGRLRAGERIVHVPDLAVLVPLAGDDPVPRAAVELGGIRTLLMVPLRKDGELLGIFTNFRQEVRPFSEKQIALLENFAAQAVIAMENARLITETREALEQQTASAEVLGVINSSPGNLAPVFQSMAEKAMRLCGAAHGALYSYDGERFRLAAIQGGPGIAEWLQRHGPARAAPNTPLGRVVRGERVVHIMDVTDDEAYRVHPRYRELIDISECRTLLTVALRKKDTLLGALMVHHQEVRPFTDKQIVLVENFAAQAVIAIENARLITETREALEQQTATAEILRVINSSPGELTPVFDAILEKAHSLCRLACGGLFLYDGEYFRAVATRGYPERFTEILRRPMRGWAYHQKLVNGDRYVHIPDTTGIGAERGSDLAHFFEVFKSLGFRSLLLVPLRKDGRLLGHISGARLEAGLFSEKEIALLESFADQAVIAMENARLITETRQRTAELQESLEYQTATSDVLKVISQSGTELELVLGEVAETASRICAGVGAVIFRYEGGRLHFAASHGIAGEYRNFLVSQPHELSRGTLVGRTAGERAVVHILDVTVDPEYTFTESRQRGQLRTMLGVPLMRDAALIGVLALARHHVEPFSEKQIELMRTFADQAVIAIENARLLGEIRQRQEELRVTFDNMADGVAMFDPALRLTAWNRNFQQLLALPEEYLAAHHTFDEYIRYLTERGEFGTTDAEAQIARLRARVGDHYSFERTRPDGTVLEIRHNPMPDGGFVLIYGDITERKRSEAEIRAARDAAEAAYRDLQAAQANLVQAQKMAALGQLTAGIAHEIKNPLNFVNNFAGLSNELLAELKETAAPALDTLGEGARADFDETIDLLSGNLQKIVEHGQRADNIVKSMLEHSRGVSGERRAVDLNALIDEALNLAYHGARAHDPSFNITLERDFAAVLAPVELAPQEVTRVFLNLFGNGFYAADKRAKAGGDAAYRPTLSVATREIDNGIEVKVRDNGSGIPPDIRDKLFQPFFTTKPTGEGTGLGLSISYDIVTQQHGGTIEVASEPGQFTEFTIRLPRG